MAVSAGTIETGARNLINSRKTAASRDYDLVSREFDLSIFSPIGRYGDISGVFAQQRLNPPLMIMSGLPRLERNAVNYTAFLRFP